MSAISLRAALETRLAAMSNVLPTLWENTDYSPVAGTPYQAVNLLPGETQNPAAGAGMRREVGIMQVTLFYPRSEGPGGAAGMAQSIRDWFPRGLSLTAGTVTVIVARTPSISAARVTDSWYQLPVTIQYFANILT